MLVRVAVTLLLEEVVVAEEVRVEAVAPVRTRIATRVRAVSFIGKPLKNLCCKLMNRNGFSEIRRVRLDYLPRDIPHAFGSLGSQVGTGSMLVRVAVTLLLEEEVEAEEVRVEAVAPVRTRTTTKARMTFFMMGVLLKLYLLQKDFAGQATGVTIE
jgi:hypothetical protein